MLDRITTIRVISSKAKIQHLKRDLRRPDV
jgi:hypothetical protein